MKTTSAVLLAVVAAALVFLGLFLTFCLFGFRHDSGGYELTGISFGGPTATAPAPSPLGSPVQNVPALGGAVQLVEASFESDPFYCRLAFGLDREHVILTAADLEAQWLYVDLNSDGKLDDANESFEIEETGQYNETRYLLSLIHI